ncbi:hypothetical protein E1B28_003788 [Marasmius oreades]|uniref:F-box domain-containing protein n=1 Tax=Marasmius oreades TaxID=181124 RepID=A0A9P8ABH5_9AGAR|nr:uncharacterized protein E1B28_003788 [Marasmius oreades]KAG7096344.1 hypothetical protein E1B28_003788 [Marasmius oreades]
MDNNRNLLCDRCQSNIHKPLRLHPIDPILLHSSHVPSQVEVSQTLETLEKEKQQLQQYEDTIDSLRQILEKLETERQRLEAHISRRHSITSVQRRIPVELWETIFSFACSFSSEDGYSLSMSFNPISGVSTVTTFPILLSHVCRRWRAISIGCHTIWSSISINRMREISMKQKILVGAFLANSAKSPLDIRVVENRLSRHTHATWDLLKSHLSRCGRLSLGLTQYTSLDTFQGMDITFHDLLSLRVDVDTSIPSEPDLDNPFWQALCHAPKFTQARICKIYPHNPLPYPQLTTLVINSVYLEDVGGLLRALELSRNLRSFSLLEIEFIYLPTSVDHMIRPVEMPSLRTLSLYPEIMLLHMDNPILDVLCSSLVMPTLSAFGLGCTNSTSNVTRWPSSLLSMLRRSSATLRHVWLTTLCPVHGFWEAPLDMLLETIPNLTHLDLGEWFNNYEYHSSRNSLISSTITDIACLSQTAVLPNLEHMSLVCVQLDPDILLKILDFAASRSPSRLSNVAPVPCRSLKTLRVLSSLTDSSSKFVLEAHMVEKIRLLEQDGVKVVVENNTEAASSWPLRNVEGWDILNK